MFMRLYRVPGYPGTGTFPRVRLNFPLWSNSTLVVVQYLGHTQDSPGIPNLVKVFKVSHKNWWDKTVGRPWQRVPCTRVRPYICTRGPSPCRKNLGSSHPCKGVAWAPSLNICLRLPVAPVGQVQCTRVPRVCTYMVIM